MNRMTKILKSVFSAALALSLVAGIPAAAWANNDGADSGYRVNDFTGLLTDDQELSLSRAARAEVGPTTADLPWYPDDPKAFQDFHNEAAPRVVDNADLLTPDQEELLAAHIADMRERLGLDRCPWYGSRAAHREQRQRHGRYHLRHVRGWRLRQGYFDPV